MTTDDAAPGSGGECSASRRSVLLSAGAALCSAGGVVGAGVAGASASRSTVRIAATAPYRPGVEAAVRQFESSGAASATDATVEVVDESSVTSVAGALRDGTLDVHVSGRPVLADGADDARDDADDVRDGDGTSDDDGSSDGDGTGDDIHHGVAVRRWATLDAAAAGWQDCLSESGVRSHCSDGGPVEAWTETDWASVRALAAAVEPLEAATDDAELPVGPQGAASDATALLRGPRAHQYATGRGGVGYYDVPSEAIRGDSGDVREAESGDESEAGDGSDGESAGAPVVRLEHVRVSDASPSEELGPVLEDYRSAAAPPSVLETHFVG